MREKIAKAVALLVVPAILLAGLPVGTAGAQGTRASTTPGPNLDGDWNGRLEMDVNARCGRYFSGGMLAVLQGRSIEITVNHLEQNWTLEGDLESDGTFKLWTHFDLYSGNLGSAVSGQLELKGHTSDLLGGSFQVYMDRGNWDCRGTFIFYRRNPLPTTTADKSSRDFARYMADNTLSQAVKEAEAIAKGKAKPKAKPVAAMQDITPASPRRRPHRQRRRTGRRSISRSGTRSRTAATPKCIRLTSRSFPTGGSRRWRASC